MRVVFMGTPAAAVPTLERIIADDHEIAAVYTQPDRPAGRGQRISVSPVKQLARERDLAVRQPFNIKTDDALDEFRALNADVAVVVAYGKILPPAFLTAFPRGCVNVHFSLLPKYRGAAPVNWAIANGEVDTGVTTMRMDAGLDTGDILLQEPTRVGPGETSIELLNRLALTGADLLSRTLRDGDSIKPHPQDESGATYAPILRRDDGLIDWSLRAAEISNRVRGFQPFPTAFTTLNRKRLTLWKVAELKGEGAHGEIIDVSPDAIVVACGRGDALRIDELQLEGKRRMSTADFLNGTRLSPGQRLGT